MSPSGSPNGDLLPNQVNAWHGEIAQVTEGCNASSIGKQEKRSRYAPEAPGVKAVLSFTEVLRARLGLESVGLIEPDQSPGPPSGETGPDSAVCNSHQAE
jgi:hypothetical protein